MAIATLELAKRLGARAAWPNAACEDQQLEFLALPSRAAPNTLSFLSDPESAPQLASAGAVLSEERYGHLVSRPLIVNRLPLALARAKQWLPLLTVNNTSPTSFDAGIHPTATLTSSVVRGNHAQIGAHAVLRGEVKLGDFVIIGPNVTITGPVSIGNRVRIEANTTIGGKPFMYVNDGHKWVDFPSFAGVRIEDDAEIGAGVTIDRGLTTNTVIGADVKLDNQVHIGHGAIIGEDTIVAARTTIAGEARVGERCKIAGACSIAEGVFIGNEVVLAGMSNVSRSLPGPGEFASAWPVQPRREWWRQIAKLKRLVN